MTRATGSPLDPLSSSKHTSPPSRPASLHGRRSSWETAFWPVLRFGMSLLLISIPLSLVVSWWLPLAWWKAFRRCVSIAAALSLWIACRSEHTSLRSFGLSSWREGKRQFSMGLFLGVGALALLFGLYLASGACHVNITPDRIKLWRTLLGFIPAAVLVSVLEEGVFRGFLLQHLLTSSRSLAFILTSTIYAFVHLKTAPLTLIAWLELGGLFLLGNVLALTYLVTHRLYLAVGLHAALAYGARVNKLLVAFPDPSMAWLVGTSRLINGVVSWVALLGVGALVIWWVRSSRKGGACHEDA